MDEFVRKVYERGKVTIPKELRDLYNVRDGDLVKMRIVRVVRAGEPEPDVPEPAADGFDVHFEA